MTEVSFLTETDKPAGSTGIGIDFGTSNSVAAIFDGQHLTIIQLEHSSPIMPTASYIDRDFVTSTGQQAIDDYIRENQGRRVEMSMEVLGEARTSTGQIDTGTNLPSEANTNKLYGQAVVDGSLPGRLFRGVKRLLGNPELKRVLIFNRPFRLVALITPIILRIRQSIEDCLLRLNQNVQQARQACIGHPVNFEGQATEHNAVALQRLSEAYLHAGISTQHFYPEPAAASLSYLHANPRQSANTILTVDFGGGTLDLCILQRESGKFRVLCTHGVGLGGDHIDQAMFKALLYPLLGKGERWIREVDGKTVDTLFPFEHYESLLLNWTISYLLNQNQYTTPVIDKIHQAGSDSRKFQRLYELITQNASYSVFQAIKDCKAILSSEQQAVLDIPEIDVELPVSRQEFEGIIASLLDDFNTALQTTLELAGLQAGEIDLVVRTGGSSLIPAVLGILEEQFSGKIVEHDAFTSVAAGLAIADYHGLGTSL